MRRVANPSIMVAKGPSELLDFSEFKAPAAGYSIFRLAKSPEEHLGYWRSQVRYRLTGPCRSNLRLRRS